MSRTRSLHATTLDILEDSLNSLYKARKKGLMAKQAKFERQQKKRMIQNQKGLRPKTPNPNVDYAVDDDDADEEAFVDSLASSLTMEPMASVPHSRSIQAAVEDEDAGPKKQVKQFNYNQVKDTPALFKGSSDSFTPLGEMKEDQAAAKAFLDFRYAKITPGPRITYHLSLILFILSSSLSLTLSHSHCPPCLLSLLLPEMRWRPGGSGTW